MRSTHASRTVSYTHLDVYKRQALVDANDTPFSQGVPLAADTYVLDTLPNVIFLIVSDYHTGEMLSRVALVADSCSLPTLSLIHI